MSDMRGMRDEGERREKIVRGTRRRERERARERERDGEREERERERPGGVRDQEVPPRGFTDMKKRAVVDVGQAKDVLIFAEARRWVSVAVRQEAHPDLPLSLSPLHRPVTRLHHGMVAGTCLSHVALEA